MIAINTFGACIVSKSVPWLTLDDGGMTGFVGNEREERTGQGPEVSEETEEGNDIGERTDREHREGALPQRRSEVSSSHRRRIAMDQGLYFGFHYSLAFDIIDLCMIFLTQSHNC